MSDPKERTGEEPVPRTRRQWIARFLSEREHGFEELRRLLEVPVRMLEDDLRHVERSTRGQSRRFVIVPPRCRECGFLFRGREARHLHPPSRCPRCHSEAIEDPRFRIEAKA